MNRCICSGEYNLLGIYPRVAWLDQMENQFSAFWGTSTEFYSVYTSLYSHQQWIRVPHLHTLPAFVVSVLIFVILALCPNMWSILEKLPWAMRKKVSSLLFGWNGVKISVRSIWFMTWFNSRVSLCSFYPIDQSIGYYVVLKSPINSVLESVYDFRSNRVSFKRLSATVCVCVWCIYI